MRIRDDSLDPCVLEPPLFLILSYYLRLIISILCYGSEAWKLTDTVQQKINGFNSRCVSVISGRTSRVEASDHKQTIDIVGFMRCRRRQYLGHLLRSDPASVLRQDVLQYAELVRTGALDGRGGILMDVLHENGQALYGNRRTHLDGRLLRLR
jgi:hypothetical protein